MTSKTVEKVGGISKVVMPTELEKLRGKLVKIVYKEHVNKEPYISEGVVKDANPSFVVVRGHDGLTHFIATSAIVRMSERRPNGG